MKVEKLQVDDLKTANSFAESWNNLPRGSIYSKGQFEDWLDPITKEQIENKTVLELGCGNASLMVHLSSWQPAFLKGIDLGDSVNSAKKNMSMLAFKNWEIEKSDLVTFVSSGFDLVYCIGVLHHLKNPKSGLYSVIRNTKIGGRFHCWVYAKEGNNLVIYFVDPLRKVVSRLPWWIIKYFVATPLAVPFFLYSRLVSSLPRVAFIKKLPLFQYSLWIAKREFTFFRHVAFDQLVTPRTTYLSYEIISNWF